jgi:hypothetical protein
MADAWLPLRPATAPDPLCVAAAAPDSSAADRMIAATQILNACIDDTGHSAMKIIVVS